MIQAVFIALIYAFAPVFHIHSKEEYHSMWINSYMNCVKQTDAHTLTLIDEKCVYGNKSQLQILSNMVELTDDNGDVVTDIVYYVFYPYNGNIGLVDMGEHYYDMEHVTIRFRTPMNYMSNSTVPYKVLYSIHSGYTWLDWSNTKNQNGRLNVYVAKGSHACYPYSGTYTRYYGVADDVCDSGNTEHSVNNVVYDTNNTIFQYTSVSDGDTGRNWNRREFMWGESPAYSSYAGSMTDLGHKPDENASSNTNKPNIWLILILAVVCDIIFMCSITVCIVTLCKSARENFMKCC